MKIFLVLLFHNALAINDDRKILKTGINGLKGKKHDVDNIIEGIKQEQWGEEEGSCYNSTLSLLYNVRNRTLWATWIWDSNPRLASTFYGSKYHIGGYDQCLKAPWIEKDHGLKTQFCLADIIFKGEYKKMGIDIDSFGPMEEYFPITTPLDRKINSISYGMCLPAVCQASSVSKILRIMFENSHLGTLDVDVNISSCEVSGEDYVYPSDFYVFRTLLLLLISMAVLSTWFVGDKKSDTMASALLRSFSLKRNLQDLVKISENDLGAVNILKTFFSVCSVSLHHVYYGTAIATINSIDLDKIVSHLPFSIVLHFDVGLDGFYAISGLLLVNSLMGKPRNPIRGIFIRYMRLVTPFAFMIFFMTSTYYHISSGPLWGKLAKQEQDDCRKNWLISIFMFNNYINDKEICQLTWWYIPTDFHIAVLGILIIYFYKKKIVGNKFLAALSAMLIAIPGIFTYKNNYKHMPFYNAEALLNLRNNEEFMDIYIKTHNRFGPYIVGMLAGYIISTNKPRNNRHIINKKWTSISLLATAVTGIIIMASGPAIFKRGYHPIEAAVYACTNRIIWAAVACFCIAIMEYGTSPSLDVLRRSPICAAMNRLAYCIYLVHTSFIQRRLYATRTPYGIDWLSMFMDSAGVVIYSIAGGLVLRLLVEAPMGHIIDLLLSPKSKIKEELNTDAKTEKGE